MIVIVLLTVLVVVSVLGLVMLFDIHKQSIKNSVYIPLNSQLTQKTLSELMYLRGMVATDMTQQMMGSDGEMPMGIEPGTLYRSADGRHVASNLNELIRKMTGKEPGTELSPDDVAEFKKMMEDEMNKDENGEDTDASDRWKKGG